MRRIIEAAERSYDLVVIDTPPTSVVSDAIPLVKQVSGVLVVCRLGRTTRDSAAHLRNQLDNLEANTLGVVINGVGRQTRYGYGQPYGYGYGYGAEAGKKRSRRSRDVPDQTEDGAHDRPPAMPEFEKPAGVDLTPGNSEGNQPEDLQVQAERRSTNGAGRPSSGTEPDSRLLGRLRRRARK
jgi:Mrp family chromosome partitioning ATPase